MKRLFYDLHVESSRPDLPHQGLKAAGWAGACILSSGGTGSKRTEEISVDVSLQIMSGALIVPKNPDSVQKMARCALESGADLVYVAGGDEAINRAASECWEVDVICHPERVTGKDLLDQKNSGLDDVMARYMTERGIAMEICLAELLSCYGVVRSQVMGRMRQNIKLAKKYGTPIIITSGAGNPLGMRSPQDLYSLGISLGMDPFMAKASVSGFPAMLIKKSVDRRSPGVLLAGLEVASWGGSAENAKKKLSGWY